MSDFRVTLFMGLVFAGALLVFALWGLIYVLVKRPRKKESETTEMGFVVDTFHDLVGKLKEKERELEELRAAAEERAGIVEGYNENILQSVPSGVISMDEKWSIVKANASAYSILGLAEGGLESRDFREIFPDERMHTEGWREETSFRTPRGKDIWLGYSLSPLRNSSGLSIGRLFVFTDLTELRALEHQAELRQRLASLGEMSAGIAHELKNSMGVIEGYMGILRKKGDEALKDTVKAVSGEVSAMDRIITDFLLFARPRKLDLREVSLIELINEAGASALKETEDSSAGATLRTEIEPKLSLMADEVLLRQAFANLIGNAAEAMGGGGEVAVSAEDMGDTIAVRVADTGHGLDESVRERIFMPFFTTKQTGTGLGLAITYRTVTDHGGEIATSSDETGTVFTVTLPKKQG